MATGSTPANNMNPKAAEEVKRRQAAQKAKVKATKMAGVAARSKAKYGKAPSKAAVAKTYAKWHAPKPKTPMTKAAKGPDVRPAGQGYADMSQGPKVGDAGSRARVVDWADPAAKSGTRANPLNRDDKPPGASKIFQSEDGSEWWESDPAGSRTSRSARRTP